MTSKTLLRITLVSAALVTASSMALAAGTRQNHHCKMADGSMDMAKNKKACLAAKGTWTKDAPPAADAASAPKK
jgi:Spy/CpxP family protein refolding chaperone